MVDLTIKHTDWITIITGFVVIGVYYILPIFVKWFLPKYDQGIEAAQIILFGVTLYASTIQFGNVFSIVRNNKVIIYSTILLCIFNAIISSLLVLCVGKSINCVALGTTLSYALYSFVLIMRTSREFDYNILELLRAAWTTPLLCIVPTLVMRLLHAEVLCSVISSVIGIAVALFIQNRKYRFI